MSTPRLLVRPSLLRLPLRPAPVQQRCRSGVAGANAMDKGVPLRNMPRKTATTSTRRLQAAKKAQPKAPRGLPPLPIAQTPPQVLSASAAYFVARTPTRNLPVYHLAKAGGNLHQTRIRKVTGDKLVLLKELDELLEPKPEWIKINPVTQHIEMKGWYKDQIQRYLQTKGF